MKMSMFVLCTDGWELMPSVRKLWFNSVDYYSDCDDWYGDNQNADDEDEDEDDVDEDNIVCVVHGRLRADAFSAETITNFPSNVSPARQQLHPSLYLYSFLVLCTETPKRTITNFPRKVSPARQQLHSLFVFVSYLYIETCVTKIMKAQVNGDIDSQDGPIIVTDCWRYLVLTTLPSDETF